METHENEKFRVEINLPDPFTGEHWLKYQQTRRERREENEPVSELFCAALAILESGRYQMVGESKWHDLKAEGTNSPLSILNWVGLTTINFINDQFSVPKNSSEPPSSVPTTAEGAAPKGTK